MFQSHTAIAALDHYYMIHNVMNFRYKGRRGQHAFELYCVDNDEFFLELMCAYLDNINNVAMTPYPEVPQPV